MSLRGYQVRLYGPDDKQVDEPFVMLSLPFPGLRISYDGRIWEVTVVDLDPAHPRSVAARDGDPGSVQVRVIPAVGIHDS